MSRKPHNAFAGYVCELKAKLGGHIVVFDREKGADVIDADDRWVVMHMPSSLHVTVRTLVHARAIMKGVAHASTFSEASKHADILRTVAEPRAGGKLNDDDLAALERFCADPENEMSPEGKAALRKLFGLAS